MGNATHYQWPLINDSWKSVSENVIKSGNLKTGPKRRSYIIYTDATEIPLKYKSISGNLLMLECPDYECSAICRLNTGVAI